MYKVLIFVGLQALCSQNAFSQAIDHQPTLSEIVESIDSVIIQPDNIVEATVNQPPQPICPQCGRPAHLCECGRLANVADQPKDNPQAICPHCGLSAELCTCGSLSEIPEMFPVNQPTNQTVCPTCGLPAGQCKCGFFPQVALSEASENQADTGFCPKCGQPVHMCKCGCSEVAVTETVPDQTDLPQSICPFCGLPIEHCTCQA